MSRVTVAVPSPPEDGADAAAVVVTAGAAVSVLAESVAAEDVVGAPASVAASPESDDEDEQALATSTKPISTDVSCLPTISPCCVRLFRVGEIIRIVV